MTTATGASVLAAGMVVAAAGPAAAAPAVLYAYAGGTAASPASCPQDTASPPVPSAECSLTEALSLATGGDTIDLATPGGTAHYVGNWVVSTTGTSATAPVTIQAAAGLSSQPVLDGNNGASTGCSTTACNRSVLDVSPGEHVALSGITITNGNTGSGGGISNNGTVTVTGSTISDNNGSGGGGGIFNNGGTVTIADSTISGNTTASQGDGLGGGITTGTGGPSGPVTITDSTISGNTAVAGGGIFNAGATVTITDSTISGNTASGNGGGIFNNTGTTVGGTIVAGNTAPAGHGPNCDFNTLTSAGYNLTNDTTGDCGFTQPTDVAGADPHLGPLADNGGPTLTQIPSAGSPAVGVIPPGTTLNGVKVCPRTDQRGTASTPGGNCTIGAVEVPTVTITVTVSGTEVYGSSTATFTETDNAPTGATLDTSKLSCTAAGGTALSSLTAGSYTLDGSSCSGVTATGPGNYQISYAGAANGFTVTKASQAIALTSTPPSNAVVGSPAYIVTATGGGSGNPVVFSVDPATTGNACSLGTDGATVSFSHPGTCIIDANQAGNGNYEAATQVQQSITVGKATPVITWANPADITWGTKLSPAQLDATASVPGTFTYTPAAGTVLSPGTGQTLSVSFTPTDTTDYTSGTATASINVVFSLATCVTGKFTGPLVIGAGQAYCVGSGATITNGVTVQPGGALYLTGGTIKGSVSATGAAAITVCGVSVSGNLTITGDSLPLTIGGPLATGTCVNNTIAGKVSITNNSGGLIYQNNTVSGSLTITGNSGGTVIGPGNKTTGKMTIKNNT